jgi:hypothetical protein
MLTCTRCEGTGFINLHQSPDGLRDHGAEAVLAWIAANPDTDCSVCDCCGNKEAWYGTPGEHYNREDPRGPSGPYAYNGGLCECH